MFRPTRRLLLTAVVALAATALVACAGQLVPGDTRFGREGYIEYRPGDLPLILTAGHGGDLMPEEIPDRTEGTMATDRNTREVAWATYDEVVALTGGGRPHLIISHLRRRKLDVNRPLAEAAQGNPLAEKAWHEFHGFIAAARADVVKRHGRGLLIDIHGHGHALPRIELGYALGREELDQPDTDLDRPEFVALSTLRPLALARPDQSLSRLVRGPDSLGALLMRVGYPAWPSPEFPYIGDAPFFRGGYIVRVHSNMDNPHPVAAVQVELPFPDLRDTETSRARFASAFSATLLHYLNNPATFAFALPSTPASSTPVAFVAASDADDLGGCGDDCAPLLSTSATVQP